MNVIGTNPRGLRGNHGPWQGQKTKPQLRVRVVPVGRGVNGDIQRGIKHVF